MMKPAPTSSLEMPQPQFLLQFFVIALDDPTLLGQVDQVLDFRLRRQGRQPILGGLGFSFRPFDEQPLLRTGFGALLIPMRRADTEQSKPRTESMFRAFSPGDALPRLLRQALAPAPVPRRADDPGPVAGAWVAVLCRSRASSAAVLPPASRPWSKSSRRERRASSVR